MDYFLIYDPSKSHNDEYLIIKCQIRIIYIGEEENYLNNMHLVNEKNNNNKLMIYNYKFLNKYEKKKNECIMKMKSKIV